MIWTCMTCFTKCEEAQSFTPTDADCLSRLFNGGVLGFRPRFFDLQGTLAGTQKALWPSFDTSTMLGPDIIPGPSLYGLVGPPNEEPNDLNPVDGTYYAREFTLRRRHAVIKTVMFRRAQPSQHRQLAEVSKELSDSRSPFYFSPSSYRVFSKLPIWDGKVQADVTTVSKVQYRRDTLLRLQLNRKPPCVDLEAIHYAMSWFDWPYSFTNLIMVTSFYASMLSKLPRLPNELQLNIIENLRPKHVHQALNVVFPHLATLHLKDIASRFRTWIYGVFSRDNVRYVATQVFEENSTHIHEIYRLRSPQYDCWPKFSVASASSLPNVEAGAPGLNATRCLFPKSIEQYLWATTIFWEHTNTHRRIVSESQLDKRCRYFPRPPWSVCTNAEKRASALNSNKRSNFVSRGGFLIPIDGEILRRPIPIAVGNVPNPNIPVASLDFIAHVKCGVFILEEEMAEIMEDFKSFVKPRLLALRNIFLKNPGKEIVEFPEGLPVMKWPQIGGWYEDGKKLLKIIVAQHREQVFLESCADIRCLFDMSRHMVSKSCNMC